MQTLAMPFVVMYDRGEEGVAQDYAEAVRWYQLAAAQGHAVAQFNLGVMFERGVGVAQDNAEAFKWFKLAAENRNADAQYKLGEMFRYGKGVNKNNKEAKNGMNLQRHRGMNALSTSWARYLREG